MPNVLFIRTSTSADVIPPLGLLYIAAAIKTKCRDIYPNIRIIDYAREIRNEDKFIAEVLNFSPQFIGFSSLHAEYSLFRTLCNLSKRISPNSVLIAGGPLATDFHDEIVKHRLVDFAVRGEGEATIVDFFNTFYGNKEFSAVKGLAYMQDKEFVQTRPREFIEDLDSISFPAWNLIDIGAYTNIPNWNGVLTNKPYAPIITSRGCPYNCIYCHNFFGKKIRCRSVGNVLKEMYMLYKDYGVREFQIIDDLFNFDLERVRQFCQGILSADMKIKLSFPNALRADRIDRETLVWLKKAGTYKISYAIETASPRLQKLIKKNLNLEKAKQAIEKTLKLGIITSGFFMIGFPTETIEEMNATIQFALNSKFDTVKFFKVVAYKNTELAQLTGKSFSVADLINPENALFIGNKVNFSEYDLAFINNSYLDAYWKFYANFGRVFRTFLKYPNKIDFLKSLSAVYCLMFQKRYADEKYTV